jgi:hypothetical protein
MTTLFKTFHDELVADTEFELLDMMERNSPGRLANHTDLKVAISAHNALKSFSMQIWMNYKNQSVTLSQVSILFQDLSGVWNPIKACIDLITQSCGLFKNFTQLLARIMKHGSNPEIAHHHHTAVYIYKSEYRRNVLKLIKNNIETILIQYCHQRVSQIKKNTKFKIDVVKVIAEIATQNNTYWIPVLQSFDNQIQTLKARFRFFCAEDVVLAITNKLLSAQNVIVQDISPKTVEQGKPSLFTSKLLNTSRVPPNRKTIDITQIHAQHRHTNLFGKFKRIRRVYHQVFDKKYGYVIHTDPVIPKQISYNQPYNTSQSWQRILCLFRLLDSRNNISSDTSKVVSSVVFHGSIISRIHCNYFNKTLQSIFVGDNKYYQYRHALSTELRQLRVDLFNTNNWYQPDVISKTDFPNNLSPATQLTDFTTEEIRKSTITLCEQHAKQCLRHNTVSLFLDQIGSFNEKRTSYYHSCLIVCHMLGFILRAPFCNPNYLQSVRDVWTRFTTHCYKTSQETETYLIDIYALTSNFAALPHHSGLVTCSLTNSNHEDILNKHFITFLWQHHANLMSLTIITDVTDKMLKQRTHHVDSNEFLCLLACNCAVLRRWKQCCHDKFVIIGIDSCTTTLVLHTIPEQFIIKLITQLCNCIQHTCFGLEDMCLNVLYYIVHYLFETYSDMLCSVRRSYANTNTPTALINHLLDTKLKFWNITNWLTAQMLITFTFFNNGTLPDKWKSGLELCKIWFSLHDTIHKFKE